LLLTWVRHPFPDPKILGLERGASPKLLGFGRRADPNHLGLAALFSPLWGSYRTKGCCVRRLDPLVMYPCPDPRLMSPVS